LDVAGCDGAMVADAVAMLDGSGENVGDGLDAAMGVPGKSGEIILRDVVAKIVEQKEGIELRGVAKTKRAAEVNSCALRRGFAANQPLHGSNGHNCLPNSIPTLQSTPVRQHCHPGLSSRLRC